MTPDTKDELRHLLSLGYEPYDDCLERLRRSPLCMLTSVNGRWSSRRLGCVFPALNCPAASRAQIRAQNWFLTCELGASGVIASAWKDGLVDLVELHANLRYMLNEWDPIGVGDLVPDEYDCLIAPLLTRLRTGGGRSQISEFLWYELEDHFGLDPGVRDVDGMANRLVAWWATFGREAEQ
jgi:hypothetical protein